MTPQRLSLAALLPQIAQTPLFERLAPADVASLLDGAQLRRFQAEKLLFSAGDSASRFFIVLEGRVRLFALSSDGQQSVVDIVGAGSSFAEAAMFASRRFPLNAEVERGALLVQVDGPDFLRKLRSRPMLAFDIMAGLRRWELRIQAEIYQLKSLTPVQRLASFLLGLTDQQAGAAQLRLPFKKTIIASRVGIEPESLSRALRRLRDVGVECDGNTVSIADVAGLRHFCQDT